MAELKRYLYDDLVFKINTGIVPIVVNSTIVKTKKSIPNVTWDIDFGEVTMDIKNAIENTILSEPDNTILPSYIGPSYYIGKRINPVGSVAEYYLTYVFICSSNTKNIN